MILVIWNLGTVNKMPYYKCNSCHYEWEGSKEETVCDWCQSESHILEEKTPLELMCQHLIPATTMTQAEVEQFTDRFWKLG